MEWTSYADAWLGRAIYEHGLGLLLLVAFISSIAQFRALLSSTGLLPIPAYLKATKFWDRPSIFGVRYSDAIFLSVAWTGAGLAALTAIGLTARLPWWSHTAVWAAMWLLYLSIVNVGQRWYGFMWEMIICEATFVGIFIGPAGTTPSTLVIWLLIWLLIRIEFGAGLIKLRGDSCWRDLTCLDFHHETQPMPGPLSWYFHHLPKPLHRMETAANHVVQLVVPFLLIAPQPVRTWAALAIALTQAWLVLSGNFAWVNFLTIVLALALIDAAVFGLGAPSLIPIGGAEHGLVIAVAAVVLVLSWWPLRNLLSKHQRMNARYNPLLICSSYGAFGSIGRVRREVVIEGTADRSLSDVSQWREYEFRGKPGDVRRRPPQVAPYHLRLGWMLWFAALSPAYRIGWFERLLAKLLQGDRAVLRMVRVNPFPDAPPAYVRVQLYSYRFTTRAERRESGAWWHRGLVGTVTNPRRLREPSFRNRRMGEIS